ncbi:MAG TPA: class I SAM-dependent methyltransferase [Pseudonocardiaceae bacterium]
MPKRIIDLLDLGKVRDAVRDKAIGLVDHVVSRYHNEQADHIARLEQQVADLREQLRDELREEIRREGSRALDRVVEFEVRSRRDIVYAADQEAALQSAHFIQEHMPTKSSYGHPHQTLEHALSLAESGGMALEFGVFTGTTLKIIATERAGGQVYGFDSFEGLPSDWRSGFPAGHFTVDGLPDVPGAELVVGWFDDTLPGFLEGHPGPVDFLHVDGDLYSSAKIVLDLVGPRLHAGSVIVFDEFFNFPNWQEHEYKAWIEYVERTGVQFTYEGYTWSNEQVIVKITDPGNTESI